MSTTPSIMDAIKRHHAAPRSWWHYPLAWIACSPEAMWACAYVNLACAVYLVATGEIWGMANLLAFVVSRQWAMDRQSEMIDMSMRLAHEMTVNIMEDMK